MIIEWMTYASFDCAGQMKHFMTTFQPPIDDATKVWTDFRDQNNGPGVKGTDSSSYYKRLVSANET